MWLREPLLGAFSRAYDCRMDEAVEPDLKVFICNTNKYSFISRRTLRSLHSSTVD